MILLFDPGRYVFSIVCLFFYIIYNKDAYEGQRAVNARVSYKSRRVAGLFRTQNEEDEYDSDQNSCKELLSKRDQFL